MRRAEPCHAAATRCHCKPALCFRSYSLSCTGTGSATRAVNLDHKTGRKQLGSTCKLRKRVSRVLPPAMASLAAAKQTEEEKVHFTNESGEVLVGLLREADSEDSVVLCHGYADTKDGFHLAALAQVLADNGYTSLRFDFCGNGESEGKFRYGNYVKEADDLHSAVRWLQHKGKSVKAILGHSKGGDTVLVYASKYDDVPKVVNCSARYNLKDGITPRFGKNIFDRLAKEKHVEMKNNPLPGKVWTLTQEDMEERRSLDMAKVAEAIQKSQVLTIHGIDDSTIPYTDAQEFDKLIKHHRLHLIKGANHNFTQPEHAQELIQAVVNFVTTT